MELANPQSGIRNPFSAFPYDSRLIISPNRHFTQHIALGTSIALSLA